MKTVQADPELVRALEDYDRGIQVLNAHVHHHPHALERLMIAVIAFRGQAGRDPAEPQELILALLKSERKHVPEAAGSD